MSEDYCTAEARFIPGEAAMVVVACEARREEEVVPRELRGTGMEVPAQNVDRGIKENDPVEVDATG